MDIRKLRQETDGTLAAASYSPNKLTLIHTAAALGLSLVLMALNQVLSNSMVGAGGLSGMGTQTILATAQAVLQVISIIVTPFWAAGMVRAAMGFVRRQEVSPGTLLEGFRRWKSVLSANLLMGLHYLGIGFIAMYLGLQLFLFTPFAMPLYEAAMKMNGDPTADITALLGDSIGELSVALWIIYLIVFILVAAPTFYRYRMVNYLIMDGEGMGGFRAMVASRVLMRRNRLKLFKVDLSFWWFYLTEIGISALCFGYQLLHLPLSEDVAYWTFQIIAMVGQLALYYFAKPRLEITYAHCYEALLHPEPEVIDEATQVPKKHPWTY